MKRETKKELVAAAFVILILCAIGGIIVLVVYISRGGAWKPIYTAKNPGLVAALSDYHACPIIAPLFQATGIQEAWRSLGSGNRLIGSRTRVY